MPLAPVVAAALTTPASRVWGIYVNGVDVSKSSQYGVLWGETTIEIAAPGSASGATIVIDDTASVLSFSPGDAVLWLALSQTNLFGTTGAPWFRGWVGKAGEVKLGQGRQWQLECIGIDALPDWAVTQYAITFDPATAPVTFGLRQMVQAIAAASTNFGPVSVAIDLAAGGQGNVTNGVGADYSLRTAVTIPIGTTFRRAVELAASASGDVASPPSPLRLTVDMYGTLRTYVGVQTGVTFIAPDSNASVTVSTAGPTYPASHRHEDDGMSAARTVVVIGSGSVKVTLSDGTGIMGPTAIVQDDTFTTVAAATAYGLTYLAGRRGVSSGSVTLESVSGAEASWVLRRWNITDANLGISAVDYECGGMTVVFDGSGLATIHANYGGPEQTAAQVIRRMASADGTLGR